MANYKVKSNTGPWVEGDVISDADLKGWEAGGGVARLRDQIGSIEDTTEDRYLASENDGKPKSEGPTPENTTGNTKPGASTASTADIGPGGTAPNAARQPRSGKS